ncbi:MAG TPA: FtsX-like permease family protein, partial [Candidatus Latescibacteria bacterium]|nr:FtsX-like permease family protein [Candidatus Latescibacterota bacterium]
MFVVLILIAVVILYYVATLSSLVVEERRSEVSLMRSRGASSAQILAVFVLEGATIAGLCVLIGPLIAASTISILGYTPAFSDLSGGGRLPVAISRGAYLMGALGGALSFIALMAPAIQASRIGVTRHRQEAARPSRMPAFQRYYFDVLLLVLSIFLFRELTEQGSVVAVELFGDVAINQALLALPGLILVASAMVLLRLFPLAMNVASRVLSPWLSAGLVLGVWQMARNPTHYARLSLLLILTAGLGIFASSFGATLERSFKERVLYSTGSDIRVSEVRPTFRRVDGGSRFRRRFVPTARSQLQESYEQVPGVDVATPVFRGRGQDLTKLFGESYTMLAVDGETFGQVAWFREDFSDKPLAGLLETLRVEDPPEGLQLPDDARTIGVRLKANRPHPTVRVTARIRNAQGRHSTYTLGTMETSDWTVLETDLGIGSRQSLLYSRPLTLVSLRVHEVGAGRKLQAGTILIDGILVRANDGRSEIIEPFDDTEGWNLLKVSPEAISDVLRMSDVGFDGDSGSALFSWTGGSPLTSRGIFHGRSRSPVPVLASKSFVKATGHSVEEQFDISVSGHRVPVRLQGTIELFPTMITPNQRFLVADLTSLTRYANMGATVRELLPNEVWVSTSADGPERGELVAALEEVDGYSARSVTDRAKGLAESKVDPLVDAGWRALLFIAFSAVLILSCLGFLVHAYVSFSNRQLQFALLRTVGFSMKQLTTMVWLEQTLVVAVGMALGTWMGGRLGAT